MNNALNDEPQEVFERFIEQANRLKNFRFEEQVKESGLGFRATRREDGLFDIEFDLPEDKERDAFLLVFRMFYQNNEDISILRLRRFLQHPGLSDNWKLGYSQARRNYLGYLHGYPEMIDDLFGPRPTREAILNVVLYGSLVHLTKKSRDIFLEWTRDEIRAAVLMQEFNRILVGLISVIYEIADLCEEEIK